jgi:hypothetical protein
MSRGMPEPGVCKVCGAVYIHKRWTFGDRLRKSDTVDVLNKVHPVVCPACRQEATGEPRGFLYVSGEFLPKHHSDIVRLLFNESDRAAENNPMARILEVDEFNLDWIGVTTTTEHLAQRLGHALEKAYGGEVSYDVSHENQLTRVAWHRD